MRTFPKYGWFAGGAILLSIWTSPSRAEPSETERSVRLNEEIVLAQVNHKPIQLAGLRFERGLCLSNMVFLEDVVLTERGNPPGQRSFSGKEKTGAAVSAAWSQAPERVYSSVHGLRKRTGPGAQIECLDSRERGISYPDDSPVLPATSHQPLP
jgi:hypothetical protein